MLDENDPLALALSRGRHMVALLERAIKWREEEMHSSADSALVMAEFDAKFAALYIAQDRETTR